MRTKDYTVGYGKPPVETRFQKGISGNPKGRPRKSKNTATIVKQLLDEGIIVTQNGERTQMIAREAMLRKQRAKALAGDSRALNYFLPSIGAVGPALAEQEQENEAQRQEQERIVRAMTAQERQQFLGIMRTARKRADDAEAAAKKKRDGSSD